jgi:hypothetical protein
MVEGEGVDAATSKEQLSIANFRRLCEIVGDCAPGGRPDREQSHQSRSRPAEEAYEVADAIDQ